MIKSIITEIGESAYFEDEPILILFNTTAPEGLREVCIMHEYLEDPTPNLLKEGSKILFNEEEYKVKKVGNVANQTLFDLGHASFYFEMAPDQELLPGSILLEPNTVPRLKAGDSITFIY